MLLAVLLHSVGQGLLLLLRSSSIPLQCKKHLKHSPHLSIQARLHQVRDFRPILLVVPTLSEVLLHSAVGLKVTQLRITQRQQRQHLWRLQQPQMLVTLLRAPDFLPHQTPLVAPTRSEIPQLSAAGLLRRK
jgi:hypothetical protein